MKIGIHNEPNGGSLGGCEVSVAVLAEALSQRHEVEILHYRPDVTREMLSRYAGVDLSRVQMRVPAPHRLQAKARFWNRIILERKAQRLLTQTYDLFVTFTHGLPPCCSAPFGALMVLFPFVDIHRNSELGSSSFPGKARQLFRTALNGWESKKALQSYQIKAANSSFTRHWTRKRWEIECDVVYPPVQVGFPAAFEKTNSILSVGRFAVEGPGKKQIEMLEMFKFINAEADDWRYCCAGSCGKESQEQEFFARVLQLAKPINVLIEANVNLPRLKELYQTSKIFWHAAGLGIDESLSPELAEHFGMTTVEAMAAGCVPVVINKGGQPEIVEHGVSGFLWNTMDEWRDYTLRLMSDPTLLQKMSAAAQNRAQLFNRDAYIQRFCTLIGRHITGFDG